MRHGLVPVLEQHAGKAAGTGFGVCYSPEFIALGSVIRDFLNPDFLLIGELDARSGEHLAACYADIMGASTPVQRMSLENAELAKIAVNSFVTTKITFANMLAELCGAMPGGDIDVVSDAIGMDTRIGRKYLTGGLGFGGPCFPRDNVALAFIANALGGRGDLLVDDRSAEPVARRTHPARPPLAGVSRGHGRHSRAGVQAASHVIEESQAMMMAKAFLERGARVLAYDPLAGEAANLELGGRALIMDNARDCLRDADLVLIATPDPEFKTLTAADFRRGGRPVLVMDFWRILSDQLSHAEGIEYVPYGRGASTMASDVFTQLWGATPKHVWPLIRPSRTSRSTACGTSGTPCRATSATRPRASAPANTSTRSSGASISSNRTFPGSPTSSDGPAGASWRSAAASAPTPSISRAPARR